MGMAATTTTGIQAALLMCLVVLAASPRVTLGNCRDDCMASCNGWPLVCGLSCGSACYGEVGITTLSTPAESSATAEAPTSTTPAPQAEAPASAAPAPAPQAQAQEEDAGDVSSVLRGLKPSPARG